MKALTLIALVLAATIVPIALAEDEPAAEAPVTPEVSGKPAVLAALKNATKLAEAGDWDAMIVACQKAIDEAQKIQQGDLNVAFPTDVAGFEAGEIESQRMSMGSGGESVSSVNLSRKYTRKADGVVVEMTLSNWAIYRAGFEQWIRMKEHMPQMLEQFGVSFFEKDGFNCIKIDQPDGREAQIIGLGKDRLLIVQVGQKNIAAVEAIFNAVPLKKALGGSK